MDIKTIPLKSLEENLQATLSECADSGTPVVVELPDHRRLAIQAIDDDGDDLTNELIESNKSFREMLAKSAASGRKKFGG